MRAVQSSRRRASDRTSVRCERGRRKFPTSSCPRQKRGADSTLLQPPQRPDPLFAATMGLLEMIMQGAVGARAYRFPHLGFAGAGIGLVFLTGNPLWDTTGGGACGAQEGLRRRLVPLLTEPDSPQGPIPLNGPVGLTGGKLR